MQSEYWNKFLNIAHFVGLALLLTALPLSNFFMSVAIFWLAAVWLLQVVTDIKSGISLKKRWQALFANKPALLIMGIFLWPLVGMLWTDDYSHGWWDVRMKLPLLLMPFLLLTTDPLPAYQHRYLKGIFLISLLFAVTYCLLIYAGIIPKKYNDVREISVFISHIRFSLLLLTGLIIAYHEAWGKTEGKILCIGLTIYFVYFLFIISSITGLVTLAIISLWTGYRWLKLYYHHTRFFKVVILILCIAGVTGVALVGRYAYNYLQPRAIAIVEKGISEDSPPQYNLAERGKYVYSEVDYNSLIGAWNERSMSMISPGDSLSDMRLATLIRYLTCKAYAKNANGVLALSAQDIEYVEAGVADCMANSINPLRRRLDDILFEIAVLRAGGNNSGHSVLQRIEFWKAGVHIAAKHPWLGVGTGDTKRAFAESYRELNSPLSEKYRLRAHNQFLTMFVTYGIIGFLYFVITMGYLLYTNRGFMHRTAFALLAILSMLTEDTLESQAGGMFFVVFAILLSIPPATASQQPKVL